MGDSHIIAVDVAKRTCEPGLVDFAYDKHRIVHVVLVFLNGPLNDHPIGRAKQALPSPIVLAFLGQPIWKTPLGLGVNVQTNRCQQAASASGDNGRTEEHTSE